MRKKPDGYFREAKRMLKNEDWGSKTKNRGRKTKDWSEFVDGLKADLRKLGTDRLEKEKLEAQANLRYSELKNENVIIKYGLPIISLFSSTVALLISLFGDNTIPNAGEVAFILLVLFGLISLGCLFGESIRNGRQKEIIYFQTKIIIIEQIEDEKKNNSDKIAATDNKKCYVVEVEEKHSDF